MMVWIFFMLTFLSWANALKYTEFPQRTPEIVLSNFSEITSEDNISIKSSEKGISNAYDSISTLVGVFSFRERGMMVTHSDSPAYHMN